MYYFIGFYDSSEGHSPKGRSSTEPTETWAYCNDRPKSVGKKHFAVYGDIAHIHYLDSFLLVIVIGLF